MGTHLRCIEEEAGWEEQLICLEGLQDRLIQTVEETVMGIPAIMVQQVLIPAPRLGPGPGEPAPVPGPPEIILKGLLDARFDGTPKKLAFFIVQVEKFL
ncbi:UNVERIFIED_CONTAM: hypothetical protein K2H54_042493 [Gekko kuhli]